MALRHDKRDLPPMFLAGQLVEIMQRRPGTDYSHGRGIVTATSDRMVKLKDGSRWRASDGYEWGVKSDRRWFSRRIVRVTGFLLRGGGMYATVEQGEVMLTNCLRAKVWKTQEEAESAIVELGLRGEWKTERA
jgi:hypothetical protein